MNECKFFKEIVENSIKSFEEDDNSYYEMLFKSIEDNFSCDYKNIDFINENSRKKTELDIHPISFENIPDEYQSLKIKENEGNFGYYNLDLLIDRMMPSIFKIENKNKFKSLIMLTVFALDNIYDRIIKEEFLKSVKKQKKNALDEKTIQKVLSFLAIQKDDGDDVDFIINYFCSLKQSDLSLWTTEDDLCRINLNSQESKSKFTIEVKDIFIRVYGNFKHEILMEYLNSFFNNDAFTLNFIKDKVPKTQKK